MVNTILYFVSLLLVISKSDLSCSGSGGCGQYATCDYEFVTDKVYGCGGIWENNGVSNGEYLCGAGYTICPSADRASQLGLTSEKCMSTSISTDYYYVSLAGADSSNIGASTCVEGGINNLFGCANPSTDFIETSSINCGPFGAMLTTQTSNNGEGWKEGWEPWADPWDQLDEVAATRHLNSQICDPVESTNNCARQDTTKGGVLCCLDVPFNDAQLDRISEWKSRAVYQILTDRFALSDDYDDDTNCTDLTGYCGGSFQGIIDKLDYIEGMGYDAIWISPVVKNTKDGYHGYWSKNIYEVNPYFGTEDDLVALADALHDKDMYLMIDVVINHMGPRNATTAEPYNYTYDYSGFTPFDSSEYFHDSCGEEVCDQYCSIANYKYNTEIGLEEVEVCRLLGLPDLNQSNPEVAELLCDWVSEYVEDKWMADAIRLDAVPEVSMEYWKYFLSHECIDNSTFNVGEFLYGDPAILGPYQPTMDSVFGYPMYYTLRNVFGDGEGMGHIAGRLYEYEQNFIDYAALGLFTDNHDKNRWLCDYPDMTNYKNALLFIYTFPGIPYGYYGAEQAFNGCGDPENREPLWPSDYDTDSELYVYIKAINGFRKALEIYDGEFTQLWEEDGLYAYSRGDNALIVLTNTGESFNRTINVNTLKAGAFCNIFDVDEDEEFLDCFVKSSDEQSIDIEDGAGKFYIATEDITIVTTKFYEPTEDSPDSAEPTEADGIDRVYVGIYAVLMTILMTFCHF